MKKFMLVFIFCLFTINAEAGQRLLMFYSEHCGYCQKWDKEVGREGYSKSDVGKVMPLSVIDMDKDPEDWVRQMIEDGQINWINGTPTFVVYDDILNQELTRLVGYRGKEHFYSSLRGILNKIQGNPNSNTNPHREEGSGSSKMPELNGAPPAGVIQSRNQMDHIYKTPEEALKAAEWLGYGSNVHAHMDSDGKVIWMPGSMN